MATTQPETITIIKLDPAHKDERGYILNVIDDQRISHVAVYTAKKGSVRGNHYHPKQLQWVYLVSGKYVSYSKDTRNKDAHIRKEIITPGMLVFSPPMVAHAEEHLEDSVLINITDGERDPAKFGEHTIKFELVKQKS